MKPRQFIPVFIVAAGLLACHGSFQGPFIFDDVAGIVNNWKVRHLRP